MCGFLGKGVVFGVVDDFWRNCIKRVVVWWIEYFEFELGVLKGFKGLIYQCFGNEILFDSLLQFFGISVVVIYINVGFECLSGRFYDVFGDVMFVVEVGQGIVVRYYVFFEFLFFLQDLLYQFWVVIVGFVVYVVVGIYDGFYFGFFYQVLKSWQVSFLEIVVGGYCIKRVVQCFWLGMYCVVFGIGCCFQVLRVVVL